MYPSNNNSSIFFYSPIQKVFIKAESGPVEGGEGGSVANRLISERGANISTSGGISSGSSDFGDDRGTSSIPRTLHATAAPQSLLVTQLAPMAAPRQLGVSLNIYAGLREDPPALARKKELQRCHL